MSNLPAAPPRSRRLLIGGLVVLGLLLTAFFVYFDRWQTSVELLRARTEQREANYDGAVERLTTLERRYPNNAEVVLELAVAERRSGLHSAAAGRLERAELLGADPRRVELQRAMLLARSGQFPQVETTLKQAIESGVDDDTAADLYQALAEGYIELYRLDEAWQCLSYWKDWQPTAIKPRVLRAAICERLHQRLEAVAEYRVALETDPRRIDIRISLIKVLLYLGRVEEAAAEIETGRSFDPQQVELRALSATCDRRLGRPEEARKLLGELLKERLPTSLRVDVLVESGELEVEAGAYDQAIRYLKSAEELSPNEAHVQQLLARACQLAGRKEEADSHRRRYDRMKADLDKLYAMLGVLGREPNRVDLRYESGRISAANGFTTDAVRWWWSALAIDPLDPETNRALAEYYRATGDMQRSEFHIRQAALGARRPRPPAATSAASPESSNSKPDDSGAKEQANESGS